MSKIEQALHTINQYSADNNTVNRQEMQHALHCYMIACTELNSKLAECARLIADGQLQAAYTVNNAVNPPLSSRGSKLQLAPEKLARLRELCKLWQLGELPEIDMNTVVKLQEPLTVPDKHLKNLIGQWRKTARTGPAPEKVRLLRDILSCDPENSHVWRENLANMEKQWIAELLNEADAALVSGNLEQLDQIYSVMTGTDFIESIPESSLIKYQQPLQEYQKQQLQKSLALKQQDIHNAHSAQNVNLLEQYLHEYDILKTHPLCSDDPQRESLIAEARQYLQRENEYSSNQKKYDLLLARLNNALEKHLPFQEIESLYESLRQTDLPVASQLSCRIENLREEHLRENHRRHLRKCLYGFLTALLIFAAGFFIINFLQHDQNVKNHRLAMEEMLNSGNYQGVLDLYEKIRTDSPKLLHAGELTSLQQKARQLRQTQLKRFRQLEEIFKAFDAEFKSGKNIQKLRRIKSAADKLKNDDLPETLAVRKQNIDLAISKLEYDIQQQIDRSFIKEFDQLLAEVAECGRTLQKNPSAFKSMNMRLKNIELQAGTLSKKYPATSPVLLNSKAEQLAKQLRQLGSIIDYQAQRYELEHKLNAPENFEEYCRTLKIIPIQAPDLAANQWKNAVKFIDQTRSMAAAAALAQQNFANTGELEKALAEIPYPLQNNCFVLEMQKLLPDRLFKVQMQQSLKSIADDLQQIYDCYELVFEDSQGICWRFYSASAPVKESARTSRIPKTIALNVMLDPGNDGVFMPIKVVRHKARQYRFYPEKLPGTALPESFIKLKNQDLANIIMKKSEHSIFLNQLLADLQRIDSPEELEKILFHALEKLCTNESMNIWAKTAITLRIMEMLPIASPFYEQDARKISTALNYHASGKLEKWYLPTIAAEYPQQIAELKKQFRNLDIAGLKKFRQHSTRCSTLALDRVLVPGGIILKFPGGCRLHWFSGLENCSEIWFYHPQGNKSCFRAYNKKQICTESGDLQQFNAQKLYHGMVFFVPLDNRQTSQLRDQLQNSADAIKIPMIKWPYCWPENIR